MIGGSKINLIVTDIDNTVFDWVTYYVHAFTTMLDTVGSIIKVDPALLAQQSKEVFTLRGSIEYPFLVQELPAVMDHYGSDIDGMLNDVVRPARDTFNRVSEAHLRPYDDVHRTMAEIRRRSPDIKIAALTDAPRYVAMWKLNKLGLLPFFDAVYGLRDPQIPTCTVTNRAKVDPEILLKHLQQHDFGFAGKIRILPDDYEKPGVRGLKTVLMDFDQDEPAELRRHVLWIGDNLRKDIGLGNKLGVRSVWAEYGTKLDAETMRRLASFSPTQNIHKNVSLPFGASDAPVPDARIGSFSEVLSEVL